MPSSKSSKSSSSSDSNASSKSSLPDVTESKKDAETRVATPPMAQTAPPMSQTAPPGASPAKPRRPAPAAKKPLRSSPRKAATRSGTAPSVAAPVVEEKRADTFLGAQPHVFKRVVKYRQPGPGEYRTPGGIGKQPDSKYKSAPAFGFGAGDRIATPATATANVGFRAITRRPDTPSWGFGSAPREDFNKLYMDKATERYMTSRTSANIGFMSADKAANIGKPSPVSTRQTSPRWSFGSTPRMGLSARDKLTANIDFAPPSLGFSRGDQKPRAPTTVFSKTPRYKYKDFVPTKNATVLDAGKATSMGKQPVSTKRSQPSWSFGSGPRTKHPTATTQVEYATQTMNSLTNRAVASNIRSTPRFSFGTAPRSGTPAGMLRSHMTRTATLPGKA